METFGSTWLDVPDPIIEFERPTYYLYYYVPDYPPIINILRTINLEIALISRIDDTIFLELWLIKGKKTITNYFSQ